MGGRGAAETDELDAAQAAVLRRTPITARRIRYLGGRQSAFAAACVARNPHAVVAAWEGQDTPEEVVVADDLAELLAQVGDAALPAATYVVAGVAAGATHLLAALGKKGLEVLRLHPAAAAEGRFDDRASDLAAAWKAGGLDEVQAREPLVVVAAPGPAPPRLHLNFLTFAPRLMDIRTRLPAEALRSEPDLEVVHHTAPAQLPDLGVDTPKVLVLQRPAPQPTEAWRGSIANWMRQGWLVVLEYDDHPELVAVANRRDVTEKDWIRFRCVHAVQTSTAPLAELFRTLNPEVRVFPNAAFRLAPFPKAQPRRVFYGAVARGAYALEVARALRPAIIGCSDLDFVVVGDRAVFDALPTRRKQFHDFVPYEEYLRLMSTCAVSLSPMQGTPHELAKSDAKFIDAAALGVLTIASPAVYGDVVQHGVSGMIATKVGDWAPMLVRAFRDEAGRRRMARKAWEYVRDERMFADQAILRRDWYRDLWNRREALNASLAARLAG